MNPIRLTYLFAALGLVALLIAAVIAVQQRKEQQAPDTIVAAGIVTRLNAGPYHADIEVRPAGGSNFTYAENSRTPLALGQRVKVLYRASAPGETARLADGNPYAAAIDFGIIGIVLIVIGLLIPRILARFPNLLISPIR